MKLNLKEKAINLRKEGYSYSEILRQILVARSTLSRWLHSVGLSKKQKQRLTRKKWASIRRGWDKWRETRINKTIAIINHSVKKTKTIKITKEKLWLMGTMLYWAEGAKSKEYRPSQGISFSNSDPKMISFFLLWIKQILKIPKNRIKLDIYLHETKKNEIKDVRKFWSKTTRFSLKKFDKIYYKKHKISSLRKNKGKDYYGLLRIQVRRSTNLNRQITGWIKGICQKWGVV